MRRSSIWTFTFAIILSAPWVTTNTTATNYIGTISSYDFSNVEFNETIQSRTPTISMFDSKISPIWNEIEAQQFPVFGASGSLKSVYGQEMIYFLLKHDKSILWVALQWDQDFTGDPADTDNEAIPMEKDDDMWIFGLPAVTQKFGDGYSAGQEIEPYIYLDEENNLTWERIEVANSIYWEVSRKLVTDDLLGRDVQFNTSAIYTGFGASSQFHGIDSTTTEFRFDLSDLEIGESQIQNFQTLDPPSVFAFFIKYINLGLFIGILILLPILILTKYSTGGK